MGNQCCCCPRRAHENDRVKRYLHHNESNNTYDSATGGNGAQGVVNQLFPRDETSMYLQHISEREPDEGNNDPSTHPTAKPIFMERSKSDMRIKENRRSFYVLDAVNPHRMHQLRKSNSCSTIFVDDSTISQPNLKNTIKCISLAIYYHIAQRKNRGQERFVDIFDERAHPVSRSHSSSTSTDPDHRSIYRFVRTLFHAAQLTAECAIITLVYIERLLNYAEIELYAANWRRVVLGAIMMASKVWDDRAVWNIDYCQILPDCKVNDMNELERQFLEMLEFNINVPSSVYAKYYFDLRTLAMANDLQMPLQPLNHERALKLEALSHQEADDDKSHDCSSPHQSSNKNSIRRSETVPRLRCRKWASAERLTNINPSVRRAPVIIS